jgi:hypothetical protein
MKASRGWILMALVLLALGLPEVVEAQQSLPPAPPPKPPPTVIDPKIAEFAKLYAQVLALKEEYVVKFGRIHDGPGRQAWREEYDAKLTELMATYGMTRAQYEEMIFKVSSDPVMIPQFEVALKTASAG